MTPAQERLLGHDLGLPRRGREAYHVPCGTPIKARDVASLEGPVATVGDVTSAVVFAEGVVPALSVHDGRTAMLPLPSFDDMAAGLPRTEAECPVGVITAGLSGAGRDGWEAEGRSVVRVVGEEDLALLPAVLFAPDGAHVLFGDRRLGLVRVDVDGDSRRRIEGLVMDMTLA